MTELFTRKTWGSDSLDIVEKMELYNPDKETGFETISLQLNDHTDRG